MHNPILSQRDFAVLRFVNTTGRPLTLYEFHSVSGGLLEPPPKFTIPQAFVVDVELCDQTGNNIEPIEVMPSPLSFLAKPRTVPTAAKLLAMNPPIFTLQPG